MSSSQVEYNPTLDFWRREVEDNPDDPYTLAVAAYHLYSDQQSRPALRLLDRCLTIAPEYIKAKILKGAIHLSRGEYEVGWPLFDMKNVWHQYGGKQWDGTPTEERLLIWDNEGFGDYIMNMRFLPRVKELAPNVEVAAKEGLADLTRDSFPDIKIVPYYNEAVLHCPITSLPAVFKITLDTIPNKVPFIATNAHKYTNKKIGLSWSTDHTIGERFFVKSIPTELMMPLLERDDTISLHKEDLDVDTFAETASLVKCLDLVVTGDTVIAHLSGALGIPTWVLLSHDCDWRWMTKRLDSPWYPTVRLFRQERLNDWQPLLDQVMMELDNG